MKLIKKLLLELNAEATDYIPVLEPQPGVDDFQAHAEVVQMVLEDAPQKLTRGDILAEWPDDFDKASDSALKRWLRRAVAVGQILCEGTGRRSDPFRYWLPATEEKWRKEHFMYDHFEQQRRENNLPWISLQETRRQGGYEESADQAGRDEHDQES